MGVGYKSRRNARVEDRPIEDRLKIASDVVKNMYKNGE
jgi:hypothetical protein